MNGTVGSSVGVLSQLGGAMKSGQALVAHESREVARSSAEGATAQYVDTGVDEYGGLRIKALITTVKQATVEKVYDSVSARSLKVVESDAASAIAERLANKDHSIANIFGGLAAALQGATAAELTTKGTVLSAATSLTDRLNGDSLTIQTERTLADRKIGSSITRFNALLEEVHGLNERMQQVRGGGGNTSVVHNLDDMRRGVLTEMRSIMNFDVDKLALQDSNIALISVPGTGHRLLDDSVHKLQFTPTPQYVTPDMLLGGALSGIQTDLGVDVTTKITSGEVAGHLKIRDVSGVAKQTDLDAWARQAYTRLNEIHNTGSPYPPLTTLTGVNAYDATQDVTVAGDVYVTILNEDGGYVDRVQVAAGTKTVEQLRAEIDGNANLTATFVGTAPAETLTITATGGYRVALSGDGTLVGAGVTTATNIGAFFGLNNLFTLKNDAAVASSGLAGNIQVRPTLTATGLSWGSVDTTITTLNQNVIGPQKMDVAQALYKEFGNDGTTFSMGDPAKTLSLKGHLVTFLEGLVLDAQQKREDAKNATDVEDAHREQFLSESGINIQDSFLQSQEYLMFLEVVARMTQSIQKSHETILNAF